MSTSCACGTSTLIDVGLAHTLNDTYLSNKSKTVHSVLRHVAEGVKMELKDVCERVAWPLYEKYGHAHDAFRVYVQVLSSLSGSLRSRTVCGYDCSHSVGLCAPGPCAGTPLLPTVPSTTCRPTDRPLE